MKNNTRKLPVHYVDRKEATEPSPPANYVKSAQHHWLEKKDSDGHSFGLVVLQWNPMAKRWSHSGNVGSYIYVDICYWKYVAHCPMPETEVNTSPYTLFLDDLRNPTENLINVKIARNVDNAIELIKDHGLPAVISFDHDLGLGLAVGTKLLHWLIDKHLDNVYNLNEIKEIYVHSANPIGAENIRKLWDGFSQSELDSGVKAVISTRLD